MKKLIASAGTIEQLETLINQYFFSTSYKIDGEHVTNTKTGKTLDGSIIRKRFDRIHSDGTPQNKAGFRFLAYHDTRYFTDEQKAQEFYNNPYPFRKGK